MASPAITKQGEHTNIIQHQIENNAGEEGWKIYTSRRNRWRNKVGGNRSTEVETRGRQRGYDTRREFPSVFVGNILTGTKREELWKIFANTGEVADIYLATKSDTKDGRERTFAFVRFFDVRAMHKVLETRNEFILKGRKLMVSKAEPIRSKEGYEQRHQNATQRSQRSYAQALKAGMFDTRQKEEQEGNSYNGLPRKVETEGQNNMGSHEWIARSILGDMREANIQRKIEEGLTALGVEYRACYMGGMKILITFPDRKTMQEFQRTNNRKLNEWFRGWWQCPTMFCNVERLAWLVIRKIPIHHWNNSLFRTIGNTVGRYIGLGRESAQMERMDRGRIAVELKEGSSIPNSIIVKDGPEEFRVDIEFGRWIENLNEEEISNEITMAGQKHNAATHRIINEGVRFEESRQVKELMVIGIQESNMANEFELLKKPEMDNSAQPRGDVMMEVELQQWNQKTAKQGATKTTSDNEGSTTKD